MFFREYMLLFFGFFYLRSISLRGLFLVFFHTYTNSIQVLKQRTCLDFDTYSPNFVVFALHGVLILQPSFSVILCGDLGKFKSYAAITATFPQSISIGSLTKIKYSCDYSGAYLLSTVLPMDSWL